MKKTELMKQFEAETGKVAKQTYYLLNRLEPILASPEYTEWLESKVLSNHKAKPLEWRKGVGNSINADCPRGQFCIYFDDGYSYQLFDEDDYPITDAEGAYSLAEAKQLCQEWLQEMVDKAMGFVEATYEL